MRMVGVPAAVVAYGGADFLGQGIDGGHQLLDRRMADVVPFQRLVQIGSRKSRMVFVMVKLHGPGVDVRLQGIKRIRQVG